VPSPITSALGAVRPPIETTLPVTEPAQLPPETVKTEIVNPSLDLGPPVRPPAIVWRGLWTGAEQGRLFSLELNEPKDGKLSGRAIITLGSQSRTIAVNGRLKDNTVQLIERPWLCAYAGTTTL